MDQVNVVKGILDLFCHTFGQKINQGKSCVFFSRNVNQTRRCEMSEALGFNLMTNLGRCVGVPLLHKRLSVANCQFIIDRMNQRLNG